MSEGPARDADEILARLDPEQQLAATSLTGPVCLLAGAGTGKTRTITHRLAYGVATGMVDPQRVMALTFTTKAAGEMRGRLVALGAGSVHTRTFHSAALSQLSYFWPRVLGTRVAEILPGKVATVADAAAQLQLRLDRPTLRDLAGEIEWRKARSLTIEAYGAAAEHRGMPGGLDTGTVVDVQLAYERLKDERRQLDFEDVLLATAGMLSREPGVLQQVRDQYRYFTIDEYQDVSPIQTQLLELWLGQRRDVCVVGDPNQTIYSFAGADPASLAKFRSSYPDAKVIELTNSYRSQAGIVDAANRLADSAVGESHRLRLRAMQPATEHPRFETAPSDAAEAALIASEIQARIVSGASAAEIAVLVRFHAQAPLIERALRDHGIAVRADGAKFFELPIVRRLLTVFRTSDDGRPLFQQVIDLAHEAGWSSREPEAHGAERAQWAAVQTLVKMAEEADPGTTMQQFSRQLEALAAGDSDPKTNAVSIVTMHAAKGLEWDHVVIPGMSEGLSPISYARTEEEIEEERRLLYVAVTRARASLLLTRSAASGRSRRDPSRFLRPLIERAGRTGTGTGRQAPRGAS